MIAIIISAKTEWKIVKSYYSIQHVELTPFGEKFAIEESGETIGFFLGGWGKIDAAASTQHIIDAYASELLINLGTCGGFAGDVQAGDILLVNKTIVYDIYERMFDPDEAIRTYTTELDVSWIQDVDNVAPTNVALTNVAPTNVGFIRSLLVSADRDLDPNEIPMLQERYQAIASDWESGAIAHVGKRNNVPVAILRGVSDLVDAHKGEAYQAADIFIQRTAMIMDTLLGIFPNIIAMHQAQKKENV
jgi:adenosylhomocysteine nucleosidase